MSMDGERIISFELDLKLGCCYCFGCHLSTPDSVNDFELLVTQNDVCSIEFIPDGSPPILIL